MSNVIKVDFKNHRQIEKPNSVCLPKRFYSGWVSSVISTSKEYDLWTSHIRFKVYETDKNFAVQFSIGQGGQGFASPNSWYDSSPVYKKDINKLWVYIFNTLKQRCVDEKIIKNKIKKEADPTYIAEKQEKLRQHWDSLFNLVDA